MRRASSLPAAIPAWASASEIAVRAMRRSRPGSVGETDLICEAVALLRDTGMPSSGDRPCRPSRRELRNAASVAPAEQFTPMPEMTTTRVMLVHSCLTGFSLKQ